MSNNVLVLQSAFQGTQSSQPNSYSHAPHCGSKECAKIKQLVVIEVGGSVHDVRGPPRLSDGSLFKTTVKCWVNEVNIISITSSDICISWFTPNCAEGFETLLVVI